ncbi:MAG: hypothetical protein CL775_05870 [Chloroflexi bacterium]|mgnify:FL=1|nr:hypothetical protein [Chloroflexota bacterium]|tara:strand:- start:1123 stop:2250 length:1128 start_codon:yes stop_codon:yes gene_type:complete
MSKQKNLVVIQLSGGNDYLNTIVPYETGLYYDYRPNMGLKDNSIIPIDNKIAFNSNIDFFKKTFDDQNLAIMMGIGYPEPNRSHFRSMDIWHTAKPFESSSIGWLGRTVKNIDPKGLNPITAVNFGKGLPRALACPGVSVASVGALESYGLFTGVSGAQNREILLDTVDRIYQPMNRDGVPSLRLLETGRGALDGADLLSEAPNNYSSDVEYPEDNPIAQSLKGIAQVASARLGTRIFYAQHGSFDTHTDELKNHSLLLKQLSVAIDCFQRDLIKQKLDDETVIWIFSEFGRRIADNGTGTDHGSGGVAFLLGNRVKGGLYGEYPNLEPSAQLEGDVHYNTDFRTIYSTILEDVLDVDSENILDEKFTKLSILNS